MLCQKLGQAQYQIDIAVCWFTHRDLFDVLIDRLEQNVRVTLILEYDTQNIKENGLEFQKFIAKGGKLWAAKDTRLMHHKFAIIDQKTLLNGSFNWTYNNNAENLIAIDDPALVTAFKTAFDTLKHQSKRIYTVRVEDAKPFAAFPIFERTQFSISELRKQVSGGVTVWQIRIDPEDKNISHISFDLSGLLLPFWRAYRIWDSSLFKYELDGLAQYLSPVQIRDLRRWTLRMKIGDLVLAIQDKTQITALGVIQSDPQAASETAYSTQRQVQWIYHFQDQVLDLEKPAPKTLSKYKGSALRLLDLLNNPNRVQF